MGEVTLRPEQSAAVEHAADFFATATYGAKQLYSAPTGTGKSYVIVNLLKRFDDAYLVCPSVEIIAGLLEKLGVEGVSLSGLTPVAEAHRIFTPIRLRNELAAGRIRQPGKLIIDEAHHAEADTYKLLDAYCSVPSVGYTATPFRGTPRGTSEFIERWGQAVTIIDFADAVALRRISLPSFKTQRLIDDDDIAVVNGEFVISRLTEAVTGNVQSVIDLCRPWVAGDAWDRPTMITVPSVPSAQVLSDEMSAEGLPCVVITGDTGKSGREKAFKEVLSRRAALVQINVVSEGIDLPLRRLVDLRPTLSPVLFMQTLGRITRPVKRGEPNPEYVCCCRNLLRHAYVLGGVVPAAAIREAEQVFGGPGRRAGLRAVGFEGLGRFKATKLPLVDGTTGVLYALTRAEGLQVTEYVVMAAPNKSTALVAQRVISRDIAKPVEVTMPDGTKQLVPSVRKYDYDYKKARWQELDHMPDITDGFASVTASRPVTEKMKVHWQKNAKHRGLDPDAEFNSRQFQALPVLLDIQRKLVG